MNHFTKSLIDKSVSTSKCLNDVDINDRSTFNKANNSMLYPIALWIKQNFPEQDMGKVLMWMHKFVRDGSKIISIPISLAQNLIKADKLPTNIQWNFETFGFAGLIEVGENNYLFTNSIYDSNNEFVESITVVEFAVNGKMLFTNQECYLLAERVAYIFRNRPNGIIIEKTKPSLTAAKKAARKAGKKPPEAVPGSLYVIKEDMNLQAKYIKQLQEKAAKKEASKPEAHKRQYRSWRRGHFRNQPIGRRSDNKHELRWIMGHWMGDMGLPIKVQATKIRNVDIPS